MYSTKIPKCVKKQGRLTTSGRMGEVVNKNCSDYPQMLDSADKVLKKGFIKTLNKFKDYMSKQKAEHGNNE